ncbi:MAG: transposase [Acidobacteriales bacterium]|nr:transposase [Terriglobales bacterium]
MRLRELAASRVRYGYRRLSVLLKREGWAVNAKRIYRLYSEEGLIVRTRQRQQRAQRQRVRRVQPCAAIKSGPWILLPNAWRTAARLEC